MRDLRAAVHVSAVVFQTVFMALFALAAGIAVAYTLSCALGRSEWLVLPLQFGAASPIEAGWIVQSGATVILVGLLAYLPANARILKLENSHRQFSIHMQDVARAYANVHQADREGAFTLSSEFDAVKERMAWLRDHPDLGLLEPDVLEVAAQMSVISRELAETYSTEKVDRARTFLVQRQEEIEAFKERLDEAKAVANDIQNWAMRVELEEDVAQSELTRLRDMLTDILPEIQAPPPVQNAAKAPDNMIELPNRQAAE